MQSSFIEPFKQIYLLSKKKKEKRIKVKEFKKNFMRISFIYTHNKYGKRIKFQNQNKNYFYCSNLCTL